MTDKTLEAIPHSQPVHVYNMMKKLATEICLRVFLDVNFETSAEIADTIVALTTTHWHGIISVPLNLKIPGMSKSTYGKALDAKAKLLHIIEAKLKEPSDGFSRKVCDNKFPKSQLASNHVLLFTSALVPKALASILTSFVLITAQQRHLQQQCRDNDSMLDHVLLEVQRMWPPFLGGRRIATQDTNIQGTTISKGQAVIYATHHAHRDSSVFHDPDKFLPERWANENANDRDKLVIYGGGSRCCLGQHLTSALLKTVSKELLLKYSWDLSAGQNLSYKWLPVSRPKEDITVLFTPNS